MSLWLMEKSAEQWSEEEFGSAGLKDTRRVRRLTAVAAQALRTPAGQVTVVFSEEASREGAFRLMGNEDVDPREIGRASHRACARRSAGQAFVFVPVDESSLNITDKKCSKGLGHVGARFVGARGLQVITAMAISVDGVPLGLCGQRYWARAKRSKGRRKHDLRKTEDKETQNWLTVMEEVRAVYEKDGGQTKPWFQLDREGDCWPVLLTGMDPKQLFTVRASHDRRLQTDDDESRRYLWAELEKQSILGCYTLEIPAKPERKLSKQRKAKARPGRLATMEVTACQVTLSLLDERTGQRQPSTLWAVLAREAGWNEDTIEWLLLTTAPVQSFEQAQQVLFGYTQRWRIEEFHKAWKSGACRVEDTQLRAQSHIVRWATILASVATRIVRLTYLARLDPDAPATLEFSRPELDAILLGSKKTRHRRGETLGISEAVTLLARLGGYTGKSSGGPPGALVIARGLQRIQLLAEVLASNSLQLVGKM
jgi:transposase-like protein/transposase Tn5 family protein